MVSVVPYPTTAKAHDSPSSVCSFAISSEIGLFASSSVLSAGCEDNLSESSAALLPRSDTDYLNQPDRTRPERVIRKSNGSYFRRVFWVVRKVEFSLRFSSMRFRIRG